MAKPKTQAASKKQTPKHGRQQQGNDLTYIAYPRAMKILAERLSATPEEVAAWVFLGQENRGLCAYQNANELKPPPRFGFAHWMGRDYISALMGCWFSEDEVANFQPTERYMTGRKLIDQWRKQPNIKADAFVLAKIAESRLQDLHPTYGLTRGSVSEDDTFPSIEEGLFSCTEIRAIEVEDFGLNAEKGRVTIEVGPEVGSPEWRRNNASKAAKAKHGKPGGSYDKQDRIREIWASGKYSSRDLCAEQEFAALDMSYSAARKALRNEPDPT